MAIFVNPYRFGTVCPGDLVWLTHFNGNYTDDSPYARTFDTSSGVVLDSGTKKFGTGSVNPSAGPLRYYPGTTGEKTALHLIDHTRFTLEMWVYQTSRSGTYSTLMGTAWRSGARYYGWDLNVDTASGRLFFDFWGDGVSTGNTYWELYNSGSTGVSLNTWHHVCVERDGNNMRMYLDGAKIADSTTQSSKYTSGVFQGTGLPPVCDPELPATYCGVGQTAAGVTASRPNFQGYIDSVRIVEGACVYGFPDTSIPYALNAEPSGTCPSENTQFAGEVVFLYRANSTPHTDESSYARTLTALGNAAIDTGDKKFGAGSLTLDGTGDWLKWTPPNLALDNWTRLKLINYTKFTVEAWVKVASTLSGNYMILGNSDYRYYFQSYLYGWDLFLSGGVLSSRFRGPGTAVWGLGTGGSAIPTNQWVHVCMERAPDPTNGNTDTVRLYVNGVQSASNTNPTGDAGSAGDNEYFGIGQTDAGENWSINPFNGKIDSVRISVGDTQYGCLASGFTVPTTDYP